MRHSLLFPHPPGKDGAEFIHKDDFVIVLEALNVAIAALEDPMDPAQIVSLADSLADEEGRINFQELLSAFVFVDRNDPTKQRRLAQDELEEVE